MKVTCRNCLYFILIASLLLVSSGCSEESPTRPDQHPFVGRWIGSFRSPITGYSDPSNLRLDILAGGRGVGTAYYMYEISSQPVMEYLFLEIEVAPDGTVSGKGTWWLNFGLVGEGVVSGNLNASSLSGDGVLAISDESGVIEILWELSKSGS